MIWQTKERIDKGPHGTLARVDKSSPRHVVVLGGGLAGVSAATILAEKGVKVTLVERETHLGGRVGAWTDRLATGEPFQMERGFHAFFRQYYNLRALMRRVDPTLSSLIPLHDYPLLGPDGVRESFSGLPKQAPFNIAALVRRTNTLSLSDLPKIRIDRAMEMLRFDMDRTYARYDSMTAREFLDSLNFPREARRMLFDVFAHSFFNPEEGMSAGELLMMFHFYFTGNPEGLIFDVLKEPFSTALFLPMQKYLESLGVEFLLGDAATRVVRSGSFFDVTTSQGTVLPQAHAVVLALPVEPLKELVSASETLSDAAFRKSVSSLDVTLPFAVWRLWLDRPAKVGREPFVGTAGLGILDNISLYQLFEGESREWAERTQGSIVELHAYAVSEDRDEASIKKEFLSTLHTLYPETKEATILEERFLLRRDCPAFGPGSHALRPSVDTTIPGLYLAGDFVKLPVPSALMERATTSGMMAANLFLSREDVRGVDLYSVPRRGSISLKFWEAR